MAWIELHQSLPQHRKLLALRDALGLRTPAALGHMCLLWLWALRDVALIGIGLLLSALALAQTGFVTPLVVTAVYAFLAIRHDGVSMLDFLRYAGAFFFGRQYYEWRFGS